MLTCSTEIERDFSLRWDAKKWQFRIFYHLGWHNCDQCVGAVLARVHQERSKCNESEGIQNWFCQKPVQIKTTACTEADNTVLTQLKNNKDTQHLLLPQGSFEHIQMVTGPYGRTREQHANPQTYGVQRVHLKNVNWILASKGRKIVCKISFQLTVNIGK
jgi:hypothetical protein